MRISKNRLSKEASIALIIPPRHAPPMRLCSHIFKLISVIFLMTVGVQAVFSSGFVVDPSLVKAGGVKPGKSVEIKNSIAAGGYFLKITNNSANETKYFIEILSCRQYGSAPYGGYNDIPDTKWINVKLPEIVVPSKQEGFMKGVFIKVPGTKTYKNKRYQAMAKVISKASGRQTMNLEVIIPILIETEGQIK